MQVAEIPKQRTISLTGRRPVKVIETDWPVVAQLSWRAASAHTLRQAASIGFPVSPDSFMLFVATVRTNEDGSYLVYGVGEPAEQDQERHIRTGYREDECSEATLYATMRKVLEELGQQDMMPEWLARLKPESI